MKIPIRGMKERSHSKKEELHARRESAIMQNDVNELAGMVYSIENFLSFQGEDRLTETLRKCYECWRHMSALRPENEAAQAVLSAWDRGGGIRELLEEQRSFAAKTMRLPPDEDACELSYNSHMFHLRDEMNALIEKYRKPRVHAALPEGLEGSARFIAEECRDVDAIKDIPNALYEGRKLLGELQPGEEFTPEQRQRERSIVGVLDLMRSGSDITIAELERVCANIDVRIRAMEENIGKGVPLYEKLTAYLSDEWFQAFDPSSPKCELRGASAEAVSAFYRERLAALPEFFPDSMADS